MPPLPLDRYLSPLEGVVNFHDIHPLEPDRHAQAERKFLRIVRHYEAIHDNSDSDTRHHYNRPLLIRVTYEYAQSEISRDIYLQTFLRSMSLSIVEDDVDLGSEDANMNLRTTLFGFADYLLDNFFLPCKGLAPFHFLTYAHIL